jgi:hypothetical protein
MIPRTKAPAKTVHSGRVTSGMSNRTLTPRVFSATNTTANAPTTTAVTRRGVSTGGSRHRCRARGARCSGSGGFGGAGCDAGGSDCGGGGGGLYDIARFLPTTATPAGESLVSRRLVETHRCVVAPPSCACEGRSCRCRKAAASSTPDRHGRARAAMSPFRTQCRIRRTTLPLRKPGRLPTASRRPR